VKPITRALSRYITTSHFEDLPPAVRHEGLRAFVNYIGCAAGGSREPDVDIMLRFLAEFNGASEATVIGRCERLDILNTTFINAMSSAALAFNDTHFKTVAHPTTPVAAALLALAEHQPISGKALLHALILGIEIQCRVGNILCVAPAESAVGLSVQGLVGGIGAAVAAGKVLALDEAHMATAIGIACNQASGIRQAQSTMSSHYTPAHAARCGLTAALLAARGFECSDDMIEGAKGYAVSFARQANFDVAIDGLGETFELSTLAYKPYPAGVVIHPIIDACLEMVKTKLFDTTQIERIELTLNPLAAKLTNLPDPRDRGQALVSLQHWAAVTLLQRAAGIAQVTDAMVSDPEISALRRKVTFINDDNVGREAAHLRVTLNDGTTLKADVLHCRGSVKRPLNDDDINVKTRDQLQSIYPNGIAEQVLTQSWAIEKYANVDAFCKSLSQP
jgi:2-methylcitrate dehydratase PrpD